jgi:hypothetical protein
VDRKPGYEGWPGTAQRRSDGTVNLSHQVS